MAEARAGKRDAPILSTASRCQLRGGKPESDNGYRCGHAPCQCTTVPGGDAYCSDHCRQVAASGHAKAGPCGCGHEVCRSNPGGDLRKGGE